MARNASLVLSAAQSNNVFKWEDTLRLLVGHMVEVSFIKRDGSASVIDGEILALVGETDDKKAITVATAKGPRSANLFGIVSVDVME